MLKYCVYCNRIHDKEYECGKKPKRIFRPTKQRELRNTAAWAKKSKEIRERDMYLCRVCLSKGIYTYNNLEVHHIIPIAENEKTAFDNDNLITVCAECHKKCENGEISRNTQRFLIPPYHK